MSEEVNWADLYNFHGPDMVSIVDGAIAKTLSEHPGDSINREEFYLVSEGLSYAALKALMEAELTDG